MVKYEWLVFNGIDYQMPGRITSFLTHGLLGSVIRGEMNFAEEIMLIGNEAEISELYYLDQETLDKNFEASMNRLKDIRDRLERIIQKRSHKEIREIIQSSFSILQAIEKTRNKIRNRDQLTRGLQKKNEFYEVSSQITTLILQILDHARDNLLQDIGAIGKYFDLERMEEFIRQCSSEYLADVAIRFFSAPKQTSKQTFSICPV